MTPIERNCERGLILLWRESVNDWLLVTPHGTLHLGELSAAEAIAEFDAAYLRHQPAVREAA